jgi:hypothetical protein
LFVRQYLDHPSTIFRLRANNTAKESENKIHDDHVAAAYGFRGGLVPGVTVYGYMIPPVVECLGRGWLERGAMSLRLVAPCYEGETVVTRCNGSVATAEDESGALYASGQVSLDQSAGGVPFSFPVHEAPEKDQRPIACVETVVPGKRLGSVREKLEATDEVAIPERLLHLANEILTRNFQMGPWIHAGSEIRHHRLAERGQVITASGEIQECFERKGRQFAVAAIAMYQADLHPIASVRHTFIYDLGAKPEFP